DVCGKTGSAQVASYGYEAAHKGPKDNAGFVAYAPCSNPESAIAVLWENSGLHGQFAAPIARDVMKAYFDKKTRLAEEAAKKQSPVNALAATMMPPTPPAPRPMPTESPRSVQ